MGNCGYMVIGVLPTMVTEVTRQGIKKAAKKAGGIWMKFKKSRMNTRIRLQIFRKDEILGISTEVSGNEAEIKARSHKK